MIVIIYKDDEVYFRFEDLSTREANFIAEQYSIGKFSTKFFDSSTWEEIK